MKRDMQSRLFDTAMALNTPAPAPRKRRQKLVSIYMTDTLDQDVNLQEHLDDYFRQGYLVKGITPMGAASGVEGHRVSGWVFITLEKEIRE